MVKIKFRLFNKEKKITQIYSLQELISKTYKRGNFEFRGRFTGLKDKNDKELYEGDIVKYHNKNYSVVYEEATLSFILKEGNDEGWCLGGKGWKEVEVIGNIYENSDLLKSDGLPSK